MRCSQLDERTDGGKGSPLGFDNLFVDLYVLRTGRLSNVDN